MGEAPNINAGSRLSIEWLGRIFRQIYWTVLDQALVGSANFITNIVLARWLVPVEYGGYVFASTLFYLITSVYAGLVSEPAMVFGVNRFRDRLSPYFAVVTSLHWYLSLILAGGVAAAGLVLICWGCKPCGSGMLGYAFAIPFFLRMWLLRRTLYVRSLVPLAAGMGGVYLAGVLAMIYMLYRFAVLSAFTAPFAATSASVVAVATCMSMGPARVQSPQGGNFTREVAAAHWNYGRWAVLRGLLGWLPNSLYYFVLPILAGLEANAALNALFALILPATQVNFALWLLLVPVFGRMRQRRRFVPVVWAAAAALAAGGALYAVLIGLFSRPVMNFLYAGRYDQYAHFGWLIGLVAVTNAVNAVLGSALCACERPDRALWANISAVTTSCTFGVIATAIWGLLGAILGFLAADLAATLASLWLFLHTDHRDSPQIVSAGPI
jgi:O-antigen/teichoic acid export membrane protein